MSKDTKSRRELSRVAKAVKDREGNSCALCGWTPADAEECQWLHSHHIVGRRKAPDMALDPMNQIALCWWHHWLVSSPGHRNAMARSEPPDATLEVMKRKGPTSGRSARDNMHRYMGVLRRAADMATA